jgi:hypothetical protein
MRLHTMRLMRLPSLSHGAGVLPVAPSAPGDSGLPVGPVGVVFPPRRLPDRRHTLTLARPRPPIFRGVNPAAAIAAFQEPKRDWTVLVAGQRGSASNSRATSSQPSARAYGAFQSEAAGGLPACSRAHSWIAWMTASAVQIVLCRTVQGGQRDDVGCPWPLYRVRAPQSWHLPVWRRLHSLANSLSRSATSGLSHRRNVLCGTPVTRWTFSHPSPRARSSRARPIRAARASSV